jgi:hypothetical protein
LGEIKGAGIIQPPCVLGVLVEDNMNCICSLTEGNLLQILFIKPF